LAGDGRFTEPSATSISTSVMSLPRLTILRLETAISSMSLFACAKWV
jgi:hypothetical protein